MMYSLAKRGDAPALLKNTSKVGVPRAAVFGSTLIGAAIAILNYFAPAGVFEFLLASSGAIALLVYMVIAISQLRMRRRLERENTELKFRMWLFPYLTWLVIIFIAAALSVMMYTPEHRAEVSATLGLAIAISFLGIITTRGHARTAAAKALPL
jgi:AAT family amino acid transporter/GABA permease